jgi:hypothetical protein
MEAMMPILVNGMADAGSLLCLVCCRSSACCKQCHQNAAGQSSPICAPLLPLLCTAMQHDSYCTTCRDIRKLIAVLQSPNRLLLHDRATAM